MNANKFLDELPVQINFKKKMAVPLKYMKVVGLAEDELRELPLNFVKGCLRLDTSEQHCSHLM